MVAPVVLIRFCKCKTNQRGRKVRAPEDNVVGNAHLRHKTLADGYPPQRVGGPANIFGGRATETSNPNLKVGTR